jgi:hypothetical protein
MTEWSGLRPQSSGALSPEFPFVSLPVQKRSSELVRRDAFTVAFAGKEGAVATVSSLLARKADLLGARFLLVPGQTSPQNSLQGSVLDAGHEAIPIYSWAQLSELGASAPVVIFSGDEALALFFPNAFFAAQSALGSPRALVRTLQDGLRDYPRASQLTLILPETAWTSLEKDEERELLAQLRRRGAGAVVLLGGERLLWWQQEKVDILSLPGDGASAESTVRLLCVHPNKEKARFSVLDSAAVLDVQAFARRSYRERLELSHAVTCSPVCGEALVTTVRCHNPLNRPLEFAAAWQFSQTAPKVDPQILGFRLAAGETYEQEFRFVTEAGTILKFLNPEFVLKTQLSERGASGPPLEIRVPVLCSLQGEIARLEKAVLVDGDLADWAGRGYAIEHPAQLVENTGGWRGPADLSAVLQVACDQNTLYLAAVVTQDDLVDPKGNWLEFGVDKRTRVAGLDFAATEADLWRIRVFVDGVVTGLPPNSDIRVAAAPAKGGYAVEVAIPFSLFPAQTLPEPLCLDLLVAESAPDGTVKRLCFSGSGDPARGAVCYARFKLAPADTEN